MLASSGQVALSGHACRSRTLFDVARFDEVVENREGATTHFCVRPTKALDLWACAAMSSTVDQCVDDVAAACRRCSSTSSRR